MMDAAEEAWDTDGASRLSLGEAPYGEIHLQDARGRGRDPGALRRGARRTRSRPREPDRGDAPRRHPRPRAWARGRPARAVPAERQLPEPHHSRVVFAAGKATPPLRTRHHRPAG